MLKGLHKGNDRSWSTGTAYLLPFYKTHVHCPFNILVGKSLCLSSVTRNLRWLTIIRSTQREDVNEGTCVFNEENFYQNDGNNDGCPGSLGYTHCPSSSMTLK
ncbi:hypothetical protein LOAG_00081 [Loa loa]|uniref:Uncharacterized protein n=1 Tax=Loa loa TaxID=7209 RepID=A0A1S0UC17_LOALO|nr:hypothetical protein LOAG_00081 [Loa loa]EFO28392.1 hypothetical protein LOAG_00081 [Loa loa]